MAMTMMLALAGQALPAPDSAVAWEEVADDPVGRTFVGPASIVRDGGLARFTLRTDYHATSPQGLSGLVVRTTIDCRRRTMGFQTGDSYAEDGHFLETRGVRAEEIAFQPLERSAGHDQLYRRVCGPAAN